MPHDDVVAAWLWAHACGPDLGVAPGRLCARRRQRRWQPRCRGGAPAARRALPLPSCLALAYPALDRDPGPWTLDGLPDDMKSVPTPYAVPALGDLAGLPPMAILTAEYDDLRPSAEAFANTARAAGVPVSMRWEPGVPHGHLNIPGLPAADPSLKFLIDAVAAGPPAQAHA